VPTDAAILDHGWRIQDRFQLSFWDALIVAAAKRLACPLLLTEDLQTNQALEGIRSSARFKRTLPFWTANKPTDPAASVSRK
jgi:predicted nucleic acid-binding protein